MVFKKYQQAIGDFNKAIELKPDSENAYYNRGIAYKKKRQYDKAIADLTKTMLLKIKKFIFNLL